MLAIVAVITGLIIMVWNAYQITLLRLSVSGGIIGSKLLPLSIMVYLFTAGYLFMLLLMYMEPAGTQSMVVSFILFFGSLFVLLVIRLLDNIIKSLE